jgi:hypothetical protein
MARPGKFDHLKPEIYRLIQEGVPWGELRAEYPGLPERTLADWIKAVRAGKPAEPPAKPPTPRLPIDPESPLEKIKHALWDIVYDPQGKGAAVQALNILLKIEAPWTHGIVMPQDEDGDHSVEEIRVTRQVIGADAQNA